MNTQDSSIDLKDVFKRAMDTYNKSHEFYTICKKNISYRKKIRLLRLLHLFPMIPQTIKNYNTVQDTSYKDYIDDIIDKDNNTEENYNIDKRNVECLLKDMKIVYDEYFQENTSQQTHQQKKKTKSLLNLKIRY